MVTTGTTYLDTVTVIVIVIENILSSLPLGRYLLLVTKLKRYPSIRNNRNFSFTTLLRSANEVWGKVMFLHLCVILFTGVGGWLPSMHWEGGWLPSMHWNWEKRAVCILLECFLVCESVTWDGHSRVANMIHTYELGIVSMGKLIDTVVDESFTACWRNCELLSTHSGSQSYRK